MAKRKKRKYVNRTVQLDIVIPVYGRFDMLAQAIDAIQESGTARTYSITLVDDGSPDEKAADRFYNSLPMNISVIRNPANMGFPAAVNKGVERGDAAAILVMNSDVMLSPGAIDEMYKTLMDDNRVELSPIDPAKSVAVGVVAPLLVFPDSSSYAGRVQHAGIFFDLWATPLHRYIGWHADNEKVLKPMGVQAVSGACFMTRRVVWNMVRDKQKGVGDSSFGALNEVYGKGTYEDIEYCIAARANGYRVVYEPRAMGTHAVGSSVGDGGFPLSRNKSIFLARAGHLIVYDEWVVT